MLRFFPNSLPLGLPRKNMILCTYALSSLLGGAWVSPPHKQQDSEETILGNCFPKEMFLGTASSCVGVGHKNSSYFMLGVLLGYFPP